MPGQRIQVNKPYPIAVRRTYLVFFYLFIDLIACSHIAKRADYLGAGPSNGIFSAFVNLSSEPWETCRRVWRVESREATSESAKPANELP